MKWKMAIVIIAASVTAGYLSYIIIQTVRLALMGVL